MSVIIIIISSLLYNNVSAGRPGGYLEEFLMNKKTHQKTALNSVV